MTEQLVAHLEVLIGQGIETGAFAPIRHPRMAAHALAAAAEPGQARMYSGLPAGPIDDGIALLILHGLAAPERARGLEFLPPRLRPGWSDQTESFESRILDAAAGAILDRGYASVTMRDIAAAAGVPKTTIFRILGSKNALFDRIVSDLYRRADAWTAPAFELQAPAPVRLIEFFSLHVQFCVRHRAMIPVTQDHLEQIPGADRRLRMERRFGYHNALAEIIRQGQREGSLRDDIDPDLARWTLMIMAASIPEWFSGAEAIDRSAVEFSDTLSRIALDGLSASG